VLPRRWMGRLSPSALAAAFNRPAPEDEAARGGVLGALASLEDDSVALLVGGLGGGNYPR
jgi:hypothetical protein